MNRGTYTYAVCATQRRCVNDKIIGRGDPAPTTVDRIGNDGIRTVTDKTEN